MCVKRWLAVFLCLVLTASFFVSAMPVSAFRLSPVMVERELSQGADIRGSIVLSNTSQDAKQYRVSATNFKARGEDGAQEFYDADGEYHASSWVTIDPSHIELTAGQEKKVEYRIHVPTNVDSGGYYIALFFTELPFGDASAASVGVSARIGVLFLLTVNGEAVSERAEIEDFTVLPARIVSHLPIQLDVRVRNTGLAHIRPRGTVLVKNMFGREVVEMPLNPTRGAILPQSTRRFQISWGRESTETTTGLFTELEHEWRHEAFGRYTAEVHITYGVHDQALVARRTFWVLPWVLIGISSLFVIAMCVGGLFIYRSSRKRG